MSSHILLALLSLSLLQHLRLQTFSAEAVEPPSLANPHYLHQNELKKWLMNLTKAFPGLTKLHVVGTSVLKRKLWALQITDNPDVVEPGEPMMKWVGNMHGNEALGRQMLVYYVEYLLANYGKEERITRLVNETNIFVMVSMNPDGFETAVEGQCEGGGRENANYADLNRDFPDQFLPNSEKAPHQPETLALMNWIGSTPFVLSANLHGGSVVASYPFDDSKSHRTKYSAAPDDALFKHLATVYASNHKTMGKTRHCGDNFRDGITNGAAWYDVPGGMEDYNYLKSSCFEITLELSCCKYPSSAHLAEEWDNNKEAMLKYTEEIHKGIKGFVKDEQGKPIVGATISVASIAHDVQTASPHGDYWRLLVPGVYDISATKPGYETQTKKGVKVTEGDAVKSDFVLKKLGQQTVQADSSAKQHRRKHKKRRGSYVG